MIKVLVLHNQPVLPASHPDHESEHEVVETAEQVSRHLTAAGFAVARLGIVYDPDKLLGALGEFRPDVVFNLYEGTAERGDTEAHVAGLLEWVGVPFTGSPSQTLALARRKHLTKTLLRGAGLLTPAFEVYHAPPGEPAVEAGRLATSQAPRIVKPAEQDASVGLDQRSVVTSEEQLRERVSSLIERYGPPILVEEFLPGREFQVAIVTAPVFRVLPLSEILYRQQGPGYWPILTYDAKWKPGSQEDEATPPQCPADVPLELKKQLHAVACQAFHLLGCRDYARIDIRLDAAGRPSILEVNPNPDFSPAAGLARSLEVDGISHADFTVELVRSALSRKVTG